MNAISPQDSAVVPDGTEAASFLLDWTARWRSDWFLNICAIAASGGVPTGRSWPVAQLPVLRDEIAAYVRSENRARKGLYFTYNPLAHAVSGKPSKDDLAAVVAIAIDLDPPNDARAYDQRRRDVEAVMARLLADPELTVAAAVDSGNGFGAFYLLPDPAPPTDFKQAEAVSALLHRAVAGQAKTDGTHNADRLMRLPGTANWPNQVKLLAGYPRAARRSAILAMSMTPLPAELWQSLKGAAVSSGAPSGGRTQRTVEARDNTTEVGEALRMLGEVWSEVTSAQNVADLDTGLLARFADALEKSPKMRLRWEGVTEGLQDPSRSGLVMGLIGGLKRAGFGLVDAARLAWVFEHGDVADRAKFPTADAAMRAVARAWCHSLAVSDWRAGLPVGFEMTEGGLHHRDESTERNPEPKATWVCAPHEIPFDCHDEQGTRCGLVLRWRGEDGATRTTIIDRRGLHTEFAALVGTLDDRGLRCDPSPKGHALLRAYLSKTKPATTALAVRRGGWHGPVFVIPDGSVIGTGKKPILLHPDAMLADRAFEQAGALADWQSGVARYAVRNSRVALAICAALAAPLLRVAHAESGGLHFVGKSRAGKSTLLRVAGSVWGLGDGKGGQVRQWRATSNGLEGLAAALSDTPLILDEIGQANPKDLSDVIYMLANESGKTRADRSGGARRAHTWRTMFVSSGETTVGQRLRQLNQPEPAGLQVRLINVPADAGAGMGVFEELHGFADPAAMAEHLRVACTRYYGTAARAFLGGLTEMQSDCTDDLVATVKALGDTFIARHMPRGADGQVKTVAMRLGLAAAAGELATELGILPWPTGEATRSAAACLAGWLDERGGVAAGEDLDVLPAIRRFIIAHGQSRFEPLEAAGAAVRDEGDGPTVRVINRAGWRRLVDDQWEYLIPPDVLRGEIFSALNWKQAVKVLGAGGFLRRDGDSFMPKVAIPGFAKAQRLYVLRATILDAE